LWCPFILARLRDTAKGKSLYANLIPEAPMSLPVNPNGFPNLQFQPVSRSHHAPSGGPSQEPSFIVFDRAMLRRAAGLSILEGLVLREFRVSELKFVRCWITEPILRKLDCPASTKASGLRPQIHGAPGERRVK
jgi:hypothetical protein